MTRKNLVISMLVLAVTAIVVVSHAASNGLAEGFLIEANLKQGARNISGRVVLEAGRNQWTTVASAQAEKTEPALKLEARATLVDSDVVEVETRVTGREERTGKFLVQLGNRAELNQLEGATSAAADSPTSVVVRVVRVRYGLQ